MRSLLVAPGGKKRSKVRFHVSVNGKWQHFAFSYELTEAHDIKRSFNKGDPFRKKSFRIKVYPSAKFSWGRSVIMKIVMSLSLRIDMDL